MVKSSVAASFFAAVLVAAPEVSAQSIGKPAPKFTIKTYDGRKLALDDLRGKVVILNYWATWCGPCKSEMTEFDKYARAHKDDGLQIIAIVTEESIPAYQLKPLAAVLSFPLAYDPHGWRYGVMGALPTSYVIDRSGVLKYAKAEAFTADTLESVVTPLLRAAPPNAQAPDAHP